jgi:hypothetical protein
VPQAAHRAAAERRRDGRCRGVGGAVAIDQDPEVGEGFGFAVVVDVEGAGLGLADVVLVRGREVVVVGLDVLVRVRDVDVAAVRVTLGERFFFRGVGDASVALGDGAASEGSNSMPSIDGDTVDSARASAACSRASRRCVSSAARAVVAPVAAIAPTAMVPVRAETKRLERFRSRGVEGFMPVSIPAPA